jgi:cyclic-di-GMP-binding protein
MPTREQLLDASVSTQPALALDTPMAHGPPTGPASSPAALRAWIAELPMADPQTALSCLLELLTRLNRTRPLRERPAMMELLRAPVTELSDALQPRYIGASFPLAPVYRHHLKRMRALHIGMAEGHELVLLQLDADASRSGRRLLAERLGVLQRAIFHLGNVALESYLAYEPAPPGVWGRLHKLLRYGERCMAELKLARDAERLRPLAAAVMQTYKQVVALSLADPYHLMQGEAARTHALLADWAAGCRIRAISPGKALSGSFYVDVARDTPPAYASARAPVRLGTRRAVELDQLRTLVGEHACGTQHRAAAGAPLTIPQRMYRDMLLRLERAWSPRRERASQRNPQRTHVLVVAGLSACHHFASGEQAFGSERADGAEAARLSPLAPEPTGGLRLCLTLEEDDARVLDGAKESHGSEVPGADVWERVYRTPPRAADPPAFCAPSETRFAAQVWLQKNFSPGGLCLTCPHERQCTECAADCPLKIRVGELVAFRYRAAAPPNWRLAAVRWLRFTREGQMDVGLMGVGGRVRAAAVRSADAPPRAPYARALLVQDASGGPHQTLIVPPAVYDAGMSLRVRAEGSVFQACLTRLVETTNSFSQFECELQRPD